MIRTTLPHAPEGGRRYLETLSDPAEIFLREPDEFPLDDQRTGTGRDFVQVYLGIVGSGPTCRRVPIAVNRRLQLLAGQTERLGDRSKACRLLLR